MSLVSSWFRINRWWLLALPLSMVIVVAGSAERVKEHWYDKGFHHAVARARPGAFVTVAMHPDDYGNPSRHFSVALAGVDTTATLPSTGFGKPRQPPPPGTQVLVAHLAWKADPSQALLSCNIDVVDTEGRSYELYVSPDSFSTDSHCVPENHPGPLTPGAKGEARPASWSITRLFLVPKDITVAEVRIWWHLPDYVTLPAS